MMANETLNVDELRADVREALDAGRPMVSLIYGDDGDYAAALEAMRQDGWRVRASRHPQSMGGIIFVERAR